jgi:di/tricarboxylate transporter
MILVPPLKTTGTDVFIADQLFTVLKSVPASVTIINYFLCSMLTMSGFVSNNATAIIIAPIVI